MQRFVRDHQEYYRAGRPISTYYHQLNACKEWSHFFPLIIVHYIHVAWKVAEVSPSIWTPATHMGKLVEVPGSGFSLEPWGQWPPVLMEDLSFLCCHFAYSKKFRKKSRLTLTFTSTSKYRNAKEVSCRADYCTHGKVMVLPWQHWCFQTELFFRIHALCSGLKQIKTSQEVQQCPSVHKLVTPRP